MKTPLKVGIIGCGLIGKKRVLALNSPAFADTAEVAVTCDVVLKRAQDLAALVKSQRTQSNNVDSAVKPAAGEIPAVKIADGAIPGVKVFEDALSAVQDPSIDVVMISTLNSGLAPLALKALQSGKHVLVEKPGAIRQSELLPIEDILRKSNLAFRVGYNHRYHPAFLKLDEILKSEDVGPLMMIRGRYGHGGRKGYEKEWRANPKLSGGGELIDQGVHLIDLAGSFLSEVVQIHGKAQTLFWDMPVDDNAFIHLEDKNGCPAWLHASCSEWKNLFSFEIYFKKAKFHIEGLGGSYGVEKLYHYQMQPEMGPPPTTIYEFPMGDESWGVEMKEFFEDIITGRPSVPGLKEAQFALRVVESIIENKGGPL